MSTTAVAMFNLFRSSKSEVKPPPPQRVALFEVEDTVSLQVGKSLWEGAPIKRRSDLWRSVLHGKDTSGERARQQYAIFLHQVSHANPLIVSRNLN